MATKVVKPVAKTGSAAKQKAPTVVELRELLAQAEAAEATKTAAAEKGRARKIENTRAGLIAALEAADKAVVAANEAYAKAKKELDAFNLANPPVAEDVEEEAEPTFEDGLPKDYVRVIRPEDRPESWLDRIFGEKGG